MSYLKILIILAWVSNCFGSSGIIVLIDNMLVLLGRVMIIRLYLILIVPSGKFSMKKWADTSESITAELFILLGFRVKIEIHKLLFILLCAFLSNSAPRSQ